ncbi:MAG: ATP-binding protein [Planctomycetota bacterium]
MLALHILSWHQVGLGKTSALMELEHRDPSAVVVRLETAATSAHGVVETIARALKLFAPHQRYIATRPALAAIKERLAERETLLLIDEAHKLIGTSRDMGLHVLRDLHDATGVPMVWCSTTDVREWLERTQQKGAEREPLAQVRSRITVGRALVDEAGAFTADDIRQLFDRRPMPLATSAVRDLVELANLPEGGHLRACATAVSIASKTAKRPELTSADLRQVMSLLVNRRGSERLRSVGVQLTSAASSGRRAAA